MNELTETIELCVSKDDTGRLDDFITSQIEGKTRSHIKKLIDSENVYINGIIAKKSGSKIKIGDIVKINIPKIDNSTIEAEDIPLDIVYEDDDIAVINKTQGMVVHPAPGNYSGTLVNAALHHFKELSNNTDEFRPGIVHRLDKDTSGLIIIAKNNMAHTELSRLLNKREVKKKYMALVHGNVKEDSGVIQTYLGRHTKDRKKMAVTNTGKEAITRFKVIERFGKYTLVEFIIETGRTHQIRVHAKHMGHPVVGDPVYTNLKDPFKLNGQLLHAANLAFTHPVSGKHMDFNAQLPVYFNEVLKKLRNENNIR